MLAIRLPERIEERLEQLAKRTGYTKAYYVEPAIIEHLKDLEDVEVADERLEKLRSGERQTVPLSQLLKKHGVNRGRSRTPLQFQTAGYNRWLRTSFQVE